MKCWNNLWNRNKILPKWLILTILGLGLVGFLDTGYLTVAHFYGLEVGCGLIQGCDIVLTSKYSVILGKIPMALLGMLFYLGVLIFAYSALINKNSKWLLRYCWVLVCGWIFTLYLIYLQVFVLHQICQYCMLSAVTSTLLFAFALVALNLKTFK